MNHEKLVYCVLIGKRISELLRESNNKQMYIELFTEHNKHYDFDNLSMYDVYEISVIVTNNTHDFISKNIDFADEISTLIAFCHVLIAEMENLKQ